MLDNETMRIALGGVSFSTSVPPCVDDVSKQVWRFNPNAADGNIRARRSTMVRAASS